MTGKESISSAISSIEKAIEGNQKEYAELETLESRVKQKAKLMKTAHSDLQEALELEERGEKDRALEKVKEADEALREASPLFEEDEEEAAEINNLEEKEEELEGMAIEALMRLNDMDLGPAPK